jgi:N-methylhydantoinase A
MTAIFDRLRGRTAALLTSSSADALTVEYSVDMRYVGQTSVLEVSWPTTDEPMAAASAAFERRYRETFGYAMPGREPEVALARAIVRIPRLMPAEGSFTNERPEAPRPWRAHFYEAGEQAATIYGPQALTPGLELLGPAVVNTGGSTALLLPGDRAVVDEQGNLTIDVSAVAQTALAR